MKTHNAQDNQNGQAQSSNPGSTPSESNCADTTSQPPFIQPTTLDEWIAAQARYRLQERQQAVETELALEDLAAKLAAHLATLNTKGNK